jgi:arginyl-tRNA synthetase
MINVLGEDHKLEAQQVAIALNLLGVQVPKTVFYAFVSLPEGRMSTRGDRVVYLDDLIDEAIDRAYAEVSKRRQLPEKHMRLIAEQVGTAAIRYNLIKVQPEKPIVFKWSEALNFEGNSAPFIQYAHVRCCSILQKATLPNPIEDFSVITHPLEIKLIKLLARLPGVIQQAALNAVPSLMADYAYQLAATFNLFYRDCRVVGSKFEIERLYIVKATAQTLKNVMGLLGLHSPTLM